MRPDIYELLAQQQLSSTTSTQLNTATKSTYCDKTNLEFWSGMITVARAISESRCYGQGGLPIPEASGIEGLTLADSANGTIKPTGTELWSVQMVDLDNCTAALTDGGSITPLTQERIDAGGIILSPTLYIQIVNASGSTQTPSVAYHKVGL